MKNRFQMLFTVAALALAAVSVSAQQLAVSYVSIGNTNLNGGNTSSNVIAAASAVTYTKGVSVTDNALISLAKYDGCAISVSSALMGAGTSAVTAMFDASNDGTNWVTPYTFVTYNANGTTAAGSGTNLVSQHWQYLRLKYITNASNAVLTNLNVNYVLKPKRNG